MRGTSEGDEWESLPRCLVAALPEGCNVVTIKGETLPVESVRVDSGGQRCLVEQLSASARDVGAKMLLLSKPRHETLPDGEESHYCYVAAIG